MLDGYRDLIHAMRKKGRICRICFKPLSFTMRTHHVSNWHTFCLIVLKNNAIRIKFGLSHRGGGGRGLKCILLVPTNLLDSAVVEVQEMFSSHGIQYHIIITEILNK